jgi:hypothetical protein
MISSPLVPLQSYFPHLNNRALNDEMRTPSPENSV